MDFDGYRSRHQTLPELLEHHAVAGSREVVVAENIEVLVPVLVATGGGEIGREQIDKALAMAEKKIPPQRDLAAVAVVLRDLLRPGIDHDGQGNAAARQGIGK